MNANWAERGACRGVEGVNFFPARGESDRPAKAVCATCPVTRFCLEEAMRDGIEDGIWGGTSGKQRRRLRQLQRRTAA